MIRAAGLTFVFCLALHALGAQRFVSVLSGTLEGGRAGLFLGLLYALTFFTVVLVVPALVLAGGLEHLARSRRSRRFSGEGAG
jgi:hypothetical protein